MSLFGAPKKTTPPPVVEPPKAPEPPKGLTVDEVKSIVSEAIGATIQTFQAGQTALTERIDAALQRTPQVVVQGNNAPVVERGISDAELESAVLTGQNVGPSIRALVDKAVRDTEARMIREHIAPMREFGVNTIGEISNRVTRGSMPRYEKYKKEIDARLATLSPEVRATPAVIEMVYNAVVGEHASDIEREAGEAAVRRAQEAIGQGQGSGAGASGNGAARGGAAPGTGAGPGASREAPQVRSAAEVGGQDGVEALSHKGRGGMDQDAFARSMGYDSWDAYQKQYEDLMAAENA